MSYVSPDIHSPAALAEEIEFITELHPSALLAGSIGRAGLYNTLLGNAEYEYIRRHQLPTKNFLGGVADIDLINAPDVLEEQPLPFAPDLKSLNCKQVSLSLTEGQWVLRSDNRGFRSTLDDRVMQPTVTRTVYGARCQTLPAQTHLALLFVKGTIRDKDKIAIKALTEAIEEGKVQRLPQELYEPFEELFEMNYRSTLAAARRVYRAVLPTGLRQVLAPTMQRVKNHYLR